MKKSFFALITVICMFSSLFVSHAGQAPSILYHHPKTFETVDLNDEITIEYTLTEFNSHTRSNTKTAGQPHAAAEPLPQAPKSQKTTSTFMPM